jgi:Phytanoyl-CoA dioxygenase (PhyH)
MGLPMISACLASLPNGRARFLFLENIMSILENSLASDGYQLISNILSPANIAGMREAITESIDRVAAALRAPFEMSCPDAPFEDRLDHIAASDRLYATALFRGVLADTHRDERIIALSRNPLLTETVTDLLAPLKWTGHTIRPRASVTAFAGARSPWHQDVIDESPTGCGAVRFACWVPLSDVDEMTGALEVAPWQWKRSLPHLKDDDGRFFIPEESIPTPGRRILSMHCGDVLILDRFLPHRSLPVQHGRARWAVVMWVKAS